MHVTYDRADRSFLIVNDAGQVRYIPSHAMARAILEKEGLDEHQITECLNTAVFIPGFKVPVDWICRVASVGSSTHIEFSQCNREI